MKRSIACAIAIALFFSIYGCKKDKPENTNAGIRVQNATPWVMYDCTVDPIGTLSNTPSTKSHNYGQVDINSASNYHVFDAAYRYAWINLTMNNKTYGIRPYDYTGETRLTEGNYSYRITYDPTLKRISLELIKD